MVSFSPYDKTHCHLDWKIIINYDPTEDLFIRKVSSLFHIRTVNEST